MGFDITVINSLSRDGDRIINSIKAAYLYSDSLTVIDYVCPESYDYHTLINSDILNEPDARWINIRNSYPFLIAPNLEIGDKFKLLEDQIETIPALEFHYALKYLYLLINEKYFNCCASVRNERDKSVRYCREEIFLENLKKLGANLIRPNTDILNKFEDIGTLFKDISSKTENINGFQIINDFPNKSSGNYSPLLPTHLANSSISALPGFEQATIDEIIDVRKELNKYIKPFRSAVLKMSMDIDSIPDSESLSKTCEELYLANIEPEIQNIKNAIHDNNIFKNLAMNIAKNEKTWMGAGALCMAIMNKESILDIIASSATIGLGVYSIATSIIKTKEDQKSAQKNEMFFLYEAEKKLK